MFKIVLIAIIIFFLLMLVARIITYMFYEEEFQESVRQLRQEEEVRNVVNGRDKRGW